MPIDLPPLRVSPFYPIAAIAIAAAIFVIDALSPLGLAIAVLYALVVILSANFLDRRGVLAVAGICIIFTLVGYVAGHLGTYHFDAVVRCLISLVAIALTTFLALKNQDAMLDLRRQASLLALTHDAIFVADSAGVIAYWNRGAEELYGWTGAQAVGRKVADLLDTTAPQSCAQIQELLLKNGRWEGELTRTRHDGSRVVVMSRLSLHRDEAGRPSAVMETSNDITDRRRAEDALIQARAELFHMARISTLGELTASIAHEVNQPLGAVVTNGEAGLRWLSREPPNLDAVRNSLERTISNGRRASEVIARLRALARRTQAHYAPLDLNGVITETLSLVERELGRQNIGLALALDDAPLTVVGDRVQLQQVIINLVMNAIQAMEAVQDRARELKISTSFEAGEEGGLACVEVSDTGIGLGDAASEALFDAFYTTKTDGMGLGLSICRTIVEAHQGRIESRPGTPAGATFLIRLPAALKDSACETV
ncbi:sensor histidine kinase [Pseudochelatococcus sp. B33]